MLLTVCASSTESSLTSVEYVRSVMGTTATATSTGSAADDYNRITDLIEASSQWAEDYIGQPIGVGLYQELVPAYGSMALLLSRTPVRNVLRVYDSSSTDTASELQSSEYRLDADAGMIQRDAGFEWTAGRWQDIESFPVPGSEAPSWLVEYEAGWAFPYSTTTAGETTSTGRTLPKSIETAVAMRVHDLYTAQPNNVTREQVGDLSVTYRSADADSNKTQSEPEKLLRSYRRVL